MNIKVVNHGKDISRVIINEPKTYNSLSTKNLNDLIKVFKKLDNDKNIKVIILEGAGKGFSAGHNLKEVTKEVFEERVQGYATKLPQSNPAWIAASQTGSVTQVAFADIAPEAVSDKNPAWLKSRVAAYGDPVSQIEFITENGLDAWQTEVARIKALHPQPE